MSPILEKLQKHSSFEHFLKGINQKPPLLVESLWDTPKALLIALTLQHTQQDIVVVNGNKQEEERLFLDLPQFSLTPLLEFPSWEILPHEEMAPSPDVIGERYRCLNSLIESKQPSIVMTDLQALLQKTLSPKQVKQHTLAFKLSETHSFEKTIHAFEKMGYEKCSLAVDKGEFAVRGGILDIFPANTLHPYRIEFWGDEIESIRSYDPINQRSHEEHSQLFITASQEKELMTQFESSLGTLADYISPNATIFFNDLVGLEDHYAVLKGMHATHSQHFTPFQEMHQLLMEFFSVAYFTQHPIKDISTILHRNEKSISFEMFQEPLQATIWEHPFQKIGGKSSEEGLEKILEQFSTTPKMDLEFLTSTPSETRYLNKQLETTQVENKTQLTPGYLSSGFALEELGIAIIPTTEIHHRRKVRRKKQRTSYHTSPTQAYELSTGDYVVHAHHGIGRYLGVKKRKNHKGIESEFFNIEYADNGQLFVPLQQSHFISKYVGSGQQTPQLYKLGGTKWRRARKNAERSVMQYASELLKIYANRELAGGFSFPEGGEDLHLFEEDFPYEETEDQLLAFQDIKKDMCSDKSMDRLVCGDVGYGKTEVAMRAAFKAVVDGGKQVAVLVPTTVLAMQHYDTFLERMERFGIKVGVLSRYISSKQIKTTLEGASNGIIDVLIGTHRILSKDVSFKNLGLIVIDEEQRFGVKVKDHLKKIKQGVDCLTLSATPIPRTLYLSLSGARDLSIISTPPHDRLPIKTFVMPQTDKLIRNAILRELNRDGQTYFIHNRVDTIDATAFYIQTLIPEAKVGIAHGQMPPNQIDDTFHAFKNGEIDILVATTIVESGLDIPNANTIFIDRAHHFGMADLYQLRGRIGRWNRQAYAYFLVSNAEHLPSIARERLNALMQTSGYGGGYKIALRDLELRGAGDILGIGQSGQISAIGFHLYCKLLNRTLKTLQGEQGHNFCETKLEFPYDASIPETYVDSSFLRMDLYRRFGEMLCWKDLGELWKEIKDRFGKPPKPVEWLYSLTRIRIFASKNGITLIKQGKASISIEQKQGTKQKEQQFLFSPAKTPQDLEKRLLSILEPIFIS